MTTTIRYVVTEAGEVVTECSQRGGPDEVVLRTALLQWLPDVRLTDWESREAFAAICWEETDLELGHVAGILGMDPGDVARCECPDGPPWTLTHPNSSRRVVIDRQVDVEEDEKSAGANWTCPECHEGSMPKAEMGSRGSWRIHCPHCNQTVYVPGPESYID